MGELGGYEEERQRDWRVKETNIGKTVRIDDLQRRGKRWKMQDKSQRSTGEGMIKRKQGKEEIAKGRERER